MKTAEKQRGMKPPRYLPSRINAFVQCGIVRQRLHRRQKRYMCNRQLIDALEQGDIQTALALVNAGADPNIRYTPKPFPSLNHPREQWLHPRSYLADHTDTAFMMACGTEWSPPRNEPEEVPHWHSSREPALLKLDEDLPLLQMMLAHGADVHARTLNNRVALQDAVIRKRLHTAELLLQHGADVNVQDEWGYTPLMYAIWNNSSDVMRLLLAHGADPNIQDEKGHTALYVALSKSDIFAELLAHGANPKLRDREGVTLLTRATQYKAADIIALLRKRGKNL